MSIAHLKQLRNALESSHWKIHEELPGNDYKISAYWKISRLDNSSLMTIAFDGLDDMNTLPVEKAYACWLVGCPEIGVYFFKISKSWPNELANIIEQLNNIDRER